MLCGAFMQRTKIKDCNLGLIATSLNTAVIGSTISSAFNLMFAHPCNNVPKNLMNVNDIISEKLSPEQGPTIWKKPSITLGV